MKVSVSHRPSAQWDAYVEAHPAASVYHRSCWVDIPRKAFRQPALYLEARDEAGALTGVLPLVRQPGIAGGCFLTSLPYFNYGGAVADSEETAQALMLRAAQAGREQRASYVELRDVARHDGPWQLRTDKVSMILNLPADTQTLGKQIGAKLRSQIRRPERDGPQVRVGGAELLGDFYAVFRRNMHHLGTPVLPLKFFRTVLQSAPAHCAIVCIQKDQQPMAAALLVLNGELAEIPWACCLEQAKPLGYNMKLYWECLAFVIGKGCKRFDFGRSTPDSGTFRFKAQWGAAPLQLHWHRWTPTAERSAPANSSDDPTRTRAANIWRRLPAFVADCCGPLIAPRLPW
ncbi:MAG: FemAB family PEP-CTERM system-associated protein [Nevskiaceae bacterium]|jgi:FemAB-related protein (PEP-CTERM system-associated)|nr:FemAB family PEP-CTERM system-associated protein [Nevskiaceae bacterium]